jgi:hypothetical protein
MKKTFSTAVLILTILVSSTAFAEGGWDPGCSTKGNVFTQLADYFHEVWNCLAL